MQKTYKSIKVDGYTMTFVVKYGQVYARIPSITSHFLGIGKTKAEAVKEATKALRRQKR